MKKNKKIGAIEKIPGGIITSKEGWENVSENWMERSLEDRLTAIEVLRQQFLEMFNQPKNVDLSVFGKR
jgi:hypothetical protein